MSAHRTLRYGKGGRAAGKTQILSHGLERAQSIEWQPAAVDCATIGNDPGLSTERDKIEQMVPYILT